MKFIVHNYRNNPTRKAVIENRQTDRIHQRMMLMSFIHSCVDFEIVLRFKKKGLKIDLKNLGRCFYRLVVSNRSDSIFFTLCNQCSRIE